MGFLRGGLGTLALGLGLAAAASVDAASLRVDYGISLAGFTLGSADLTGAIDGDRYNLRANAKLTGLVGAVAGGSGSAVATGSLAGSRVSPASFSITGRSSAGDRTLQMTLPGGNVASVQIQPPIEVKPDRVPLSEAHKRGIIDPLGAMVMPLATANPLDPENCRRTVPVFDGTARFNVLLAYGGTKAVEKPGFSGTVLVCNARYVPIAGHRANRAVIQFMRENRDMSVWLAPLEGSRLLLPLRISVRTMLGTSVIEAQRLSFEGGAEKPRAQR
jgi:hypothetical protein